MSIASEITRLQNAKSTLKTKLNAKNDEQHQITNETIDEYGDFVDSIQSSNIIGATAEGESLSLTNTKAMPYSDYVVEGKSEQDGEPSPSNPSEIHSVADDVNLFDGETEVIAENTYNGLLVLDRNSFWYNRVDISKIEFPLTISTYIYNNTSNITDTNVRISLKDENYNDVLFKLGTSVTNDNKRSVVTIEKSEITNEMKYLSLFVRIQGGGHTENTKIQYSSTVTPYSPYNQGTVTIKQRGKNLFDLKSYLTDRSVTYTENTDGSLTFSTTINLYSNTFTFSSSNTNVSLSGIITDGTATNGRIQLLNSSNVVVGEITSSKISYENLNANQLRFNYSTSGTITLKNIQLEEGSTSTPYEPYQANDFTFQTEPLRSLPNGVKDTIEAEQHRKIGKQTGTLTETTTITLSDAKTNGAYMCNIKPSGTLTGKTIELEAGDYEIIYELEEEIIEPLTQNQATTMLDIIKTGSYEGTTNIYTDEDVKPTIGVGYYKKA